MVDFNEMELLAKFRRRDIENCEAHLKRAYKRVDRLLSKIEVELRSRGFSEDKEPVCNPEQVKYLRKAIVNLVEYSMEAAEAKVKL